MEEFGEGNVVACSPHNLRRFVGANTKAVGISTMDPLGMGFVSRTYTSLVAMGGESIAAAEFRFLVRHGVWREYRPKKIVGGSGAWQIVRADVQDEYEIDTVVIGEGERDMLEVFRKALRGERLPRVVKNENQSFGKFQL